MVRPWRLHLVVAANQANHIGLAMCFRQKMVWQNSWATVTQSIKAVLGWKFRVQDLIHEPKVLLVSLTHLVAHMCWAHAKGPKETDPYPPNHTSSISPNKSHELGPCLKKK